MCAAYADCPFLCQLALYGQVWSVIHAGGSTPPYYTERKSKVNLSHEEHVFLHFLYMEAEKCAILSEIYVLYWRFRKISGCFCIIFS